MLQVLGATAEKKARTSRTLRVRRSHRAPVCPRCTASRRTALTPSSDSRPHPPTPRPTEPLHPLCSKWRCCQRRKGTGHIHPRARPRAALLSALRCSAQRL
eukprot:496813-Prymnesium_polylepis.1